MTLRDTVSTEWPARDEIIRPPYRREIDYRQPGNFVPSQIVALPKNRHQPYKFDEK
jgi:hypothetical protein